MPFVYTTTHTAADAYQRVLDYVGASLHRDTFDEQIINDTRNGLATATGSGLSKGFINTQDDNKPSGASTSWSAWPTLESAEALTDTDGDGLPDDWETAHGLDPKKSADGNQLNEEGYTNLEVYLNSLVADITAAQNEGGELMGGEPQAVSELEVSGMTSYDNWSFAGGLKISSMSGTPATGNAGTLKFSSNKKYTIILPADVTIDAVTIYGYGNAEGQSIYLSELAGQTFAATDYVFPARDASPAFAVYTIQLATPVTEQLTFTPAGNAQSCLWLKLHTVNNETGIRAITTASYGSDALYDLQGRKVQDVQLKKGLYIRNGKKILVR
jgi:hypothetical protein